MDVCDDRLGSDLVVGLYLYCDKAIQTKRSVEKSAFKEMWSHYYIIYIVCAIVLIFSVLSAELIWLGNHQDDGYYLTKIMTLPYLDQPFATSYASGFSNQTAGIDPYLFQYLGA